MKPRRSMAFLFIAAITGICIAASSEYVDVLDAPAMKSRLAAKTLLNGITSAGKRLVSVGQRGNIIYSDDGGKNWTQASVPVSSDLVAVHFPTPQKGWAVGHDGVVLHSSDGGVTWVKQLDGRGAAQIMASHYREGSDCTGCHERVDRALSGKPPCDAAGVLMGNVKRFVEQGPDKPFLDVWFENETTGFIIGAFNLIFRTTDGGKVWDPWFDRTDNAKMFHLYALRSIGNDLFICGEQGLVLKLDRVNARFRPLKTPYNGTYFGMVSKPGVLIVYGLRGNVYRSSDGGSNWDKIETGIQVGIVGGTVTEDGRVFLVSQGGQVLASSDDGVSFSEIKLDKPFPATTVAAVGNDSLVLAGLFGIAEQKIK